LKAWVIESGKPTVPFQLTPIFGIKDLISRLPKRYGARFCKGESKSGYEICQIFYSGKRAMKSRWKTKKHEGDANKNYRAGGRCPTSESDRHS